MARHADIQYVEYPVDGTAARKVQQQNQHRTAAPVYARRRAHRRVIAVDPVAICGIVLSAVMLLVMVVGLAEYRSSLRQTQQMSTHVRQLRQENAALQQTYRAGYDLEEIERIALEAGMVSSDNMERVRISMQAPEEDDTRMSFWDTLTSFLTGIFA